MLRFQSTFPRGERRFLRGGSRLVSYFNPRSLVGNDVLRRAACPLLFYFNPRSLVGNDGNQNIRRNQNGNFNPRSLVGNDGISLRWSRLSSISIHVPSWGTTMLPLFVASLILISIHVPSWGTTMRWLPPGSNSWISIHVPSWGTTSGPPVIFISSRNFNPRSLVGNDGKFSQIFFVFLCNKYNFSTFYYPFSLFFSVIHVTFLIFVVRILPAFYVYF